MKMSRKNAFSMAEAIMVIVLIGTVIGITIPAFFHNYRGSEVRAKIKKSTALYESVFKKLAVDNNCLSDSCMKKITCDNIKRAFRVIAEEPYTNQAEQTPCIFKSSENVWWNMTDITRPVVATKKNNLDNLRDLGAGYMFFGNVNRGILRINDAGGDLSDAERAQFNRLFQLIRN